VSKFRKGIGDLARTVAGLGEKSSKRSLVPFFSLKHKSRPPSGILPDISLDHQSGDKHVRSVG
jgi:hypothetical protein